MDNLNELDEVERKKIVFAGVCKQCHKGFNITQGEKHHFESRGLSLPKRCAECRKANQVNVPKSIQIPLGGKSE